MAAGVAKYVDGRAVPIYRLEIPLQRPQLQELVRVDVAGPRFHVKRIVVNPAGTLSLQSHHHRSEHWVVVEGTAHVTIGGETRLAAENESVYVPLGAIHRLHNPGKIPLVLIEVQTGGYLAEDDIVRHEDVYARP